MQCAVDCVGARLIGWRALRVRCRRLLIRFTIPAPVGQHDLVVPATGRHHRIAVFLHYLRIAVKDTRDYERLLREKLYKIPGIRHSKSSFVLRVLKDTSVPAV